MKWLERVNPVPVIFLGLAAVCLFNSGMSGGFVASELVTRFSRDSLIVLAMLLPIVAGMGINFAVVVGAINAQVAYLLAIILGVQGWPGLALVIAVGVILSAATGRLMGSLLNRLQGREMIATIMMSWLYAAVYQLVFLWGYGTWLPALNKDIVLSRGFGVRNMVDLAPFRHILDNPARISIAGLEIPLMLILIVAVFCGFVYYLLHTPYGQRLRATGFDAGKTRLLGLDTEGSRRRAMIISTVIACLGQVVFLQNFGMLNVYTAHQNSDIFAAAALLAGGATIREARIRNVVTGVLLFHCLFIVAPQAGQNMFGDAVLGEYLRSFAAYGTIALALILNVRRQEKGNNAAGIENEK